MHAASVGEAQVAVAILKALWARRPARVHLTFQTSTGLAQARRLLSSSKCSLALAPWDGPQTLRGYLQGLSPRLLVLIETELWPNLIKEALQAGTRVILLNGRLSARRFRRYRLTRPLWAPLLRHFTFLGVISEADRDRFLKLGAPPERIQVLGNAKHDLLWERTHTLGYQELKGLVDRLGLSPSEKVLVFGSFRAGEEEAVREMVQALKDLPGVRFVVVPRHPERARAFYESLAPLGLPVAFFKGAQGLQGFRVVIVDEIGPLFSLYALAEAAVVGGSFAPLGGQNPIEPAVWGKPVLFGPYLENFPLEKEVLLTEGGACQVDSPEKGAQVLKTWLTEPRERERRARQAFRAASKLKGASQRYAQILARFL